MMDQQQLEMVNRLYSAILEPDSWAGLMEQLSDDIEARGVNMLLIDRVLAEMQGSWVSPGMQAPFQEYMAREFFRLEEPLLGSFGSSMDASSLVDTDEIEAAHNACSAVPVDLSPIRNWLRDSYGVTARYLCNLNHMGSHLGSLSVSYHRDREPDLPRLVARCNQYLPHLSNLLNVSRPFLLLQARFNAVLEVLDRFRLGVFLLGENGELMVRNAAADDLLARADGVRVDTLRRLQFADGDAQQKLQQAVLAVTQPIEISGKKRHRLVAQKPSGEAGLLLEVSPLLHGELPVGAMVIVSDPTDTALVDTHHFSELFGLTGAEQAVCQLLAEGNRSAEIAEMRNTRVETVRGQVKSVLAKTCTGQQTELVRLAQSVNIPVDPADQAD